MPHNILKRQIEKSIQNGKLNTDHLFDLISETYKQIDDERNRNDRSSRLLAEEMDTLNANLQLAVSDLKDKNIMFKAAIENMFHGLCMFDKNNDILIWNQKFLEIFRLTEGAIKPGFTLYQCISSSPTYQQRGDVYCRGLAAEMASMLTDNKPKQFITKLPDGRTLRVSHQPLDEKGSVQTIEDISEKVSVEKKMHHMAHHDVLTGLSNRVLFNERLQQVTQSNKNSMGSSAILCMDLDHFKEVNDTLGHAVGDRLLVEVADRIKILIKAGDTFSRLGGDEFAIIQTGVNDIQEVKNLANAIIEEIRSSFYIDGNEVFVGISIGIVFCGEGCKLKPYELLRNADLALYRAKTEGKGVFSFYKEEFSYQLNLRKKRETELRLALSEKHFEIYYQPQVNSVDYTIVGAEALIRWNHPSQGQVSPADFISITEEIGLIAPITEFALRTACVDFADLTELKIAINLSPLQFRKSGIFEMVEDVITEYDFNPERLALEITENALLVDSQATLNTLEQLKSLGISIVMDDFGTGYSSLSYLRSFPFDKLKIDQGFIKELGYNNEANSIVQAVIRLGKSLGMRVNAEGIENKNQASLLKLEGCDELQGYYFGRPMKITDFKKLLNKKTKTTQYIPGLAG